MDVEDSMAYTLSPRCFTKRKNRPLQLAHVQATLLTLSVTSVLLSPPGSAGMWVTSISPCISSRWMLLHFGQGAGMTPFSWTSSPLTSFLGFDLVSSTEAT